MLYFKQRGRPEDPKNVAIVRHIQSLTETISVSPLNQKPKTERRRAKTTTSKKFTQPKPITSKTTMESFLVKKIGDEKSNNGTIAERIQSQIYECKESVSEKSISWEERTAALLKEILDETSDKNDVMKTIQETQAEIDLANQQLLELNKLLGEQPKKKKTQIKNKSMQRIMQLDVRSGWEWMPETYLDNVINKK